MKPKKGIRMSAQPKNDYFLWFVFLVQPRGERERIDPDQLKQRQQEGGGVTFGTAYQARSCPNNPASCLECS
jgi:hypothetical protein